MDPANILKVEDDLYCGGQPSELELAELARAGVRSVINLRPTGEFEGFDESRVVSGLGMRYRQIAIAGSVDLSREKIAEFSMALAQARARGPALVYCRSGNRVGAAIALVDAWMHGCCPDAALAHGRRAGMTGLEAAVTKLIGR